MTVLTGLIDASAKASTALALSAGIVVAASATPATARADFLAAITSSGVSVADQNHAVGMAPSVCPGIAISTYQPVPGI